MSPTPTLDYFESDQVRLAVALWKLAKRAKEPDFDVLRFSREWAYADAVLMLCMRSEDEAVSNATIELMQLRACLEQQKPELARRLGAKSNAAPGTEPTAAIPAARSSAPVQRDHDGQSMRQPSPPQKPSQPASDREATATVAPQRYTKSLR